jgi:hypothetical protein
VEKEKIMTGKFQVISERLNSFESKKRGRIEQKILALLDLDDKCPLINTVDYVLSEDEEKEYAGKSRGKTVHIGIEETKVDFGGRTILKGRIIKPS